MHTLSSKPKKVYFKEGVLAEYKCFAKFKVGYICSKKQSCHPTRSLWSGETIVVCVVVSAKVILPKQSTLFFWPQRLTMFQFPEGLSARNDLFRDHQPKMFNSLVPLVQQYIPVCAHVCWCLTGLLATSKCKSPHQLLSIVLCFAAWE